MHKNEILVASTYPVLREGIRAALGEPYVIWEAGDSDQAVRLARARVPRVGVIDLDLRGGGCATARQIARELPTVGVIMLAERCNEQDLLEAVRVGAVGYIGKDADSGALAQAVTAVLTGEAAIPRKLVSSLLDAVKVHSTQDVRPDPRLAGLTQREAEVLAMVREGRSTQSIAAQLFVAPVTVRTHVSSIVHKLRVSDRRALVDAAASTG